MKNTELSHLSYIKLSKCFIRTGDTIREDEGHYQFQEFFLQTQTSKAFQGRLHTVLSCFKNMTERNYSELIKYGSTKGKLESYNELLYSGEIKKKESLH